MTDDLGFELTPEMEEELTGNRGEEPEGGDDERQPAD